MPCGVWAVASELASCADAERWARSAGAAAAWTFRLPRRGDRAAVAMLRRLRRHAPWLAVHGRLDWAVAAGADAVIGGARSLPWPDLAALSHERGIRFGCSVHDAEELRAARDAGADFVFFGPVWDTPAKRGVLAPRGLAVLSEACRAPLPVVAIGGIREADQVRDCRAAGAGGVAVLRAAREARRLLALQQAWASGA